MIAPDYLPTDVLAEYESWGANCGPGAIAAVLGLDVKDVRRLVQPFRGFMNPTEVMRAFRTAGRKPEKIDRPRTAGLAYVQWKGPWEKGGARACYAHTHWIAYRVYSPSRVDFYDVNAGKAGDWLWEKHWSERVAPKLYPKRCTGHDFKLWIEIGGEA